MVSAVNRQVLLKSRPDGAPSLDNFELTQAPIPEPGEGEVLMDGVFACLQEKKSQASAKCQAQYDAESKTAAKK